MGEVRCARTGLRSSWKLSGGSMWSAAVTKVSKKRHVRRATSRRHRASAAADRLDDRNVGRQAGPARDGGRSNPQDRERQRERPRSRARPNAIKATAPIASDDGAGHLPIEAEEIEPRADLAPGRP